MARYRMRQHLFSFGDDFTVQDDEGNAAFEVDGKAFSLRETFEIRDTQGNEVATIRGKLFSLHETMNIFRGGEVIATVKKAWLAMLRDRFVIDVGHDSQLVAQGDILGHEYAIRRDERIVGTVSKRWFTLSDTYGIDVAGGEDAGLIIAIAVAIDEMAHDDKRR